MKDAARSLRRSFEKRCEKGEKGTMTKRIPLDRLCQISKQRNIRRPPLLNDEKGQVEGAGRSDALTAEWPIRS